MRNRAEESSIACGARSCERWLCNMFDKDKCTRLSETER